MGIVGRSPGVTLVTAGGARARAGAAAIWG
jgi:hypothetical protein